MSGFLQLSTIPHAVKLNVSIGHATSLMHNTVASRVTDIYPLGTSRGGQMAIYSGDGLISHLIRRIVMYVLTDEAIRQRATLLLLQHLLPIGLA